MSNHIYNHPWLVHYKKSTFHHYFARYPRKKELLKSFAYGDHKMKKIDYDNMEIWL